VNGPGREELNHVIPSASDLTAIWMSQAAVTAIALEHWRNPPPQLRQRITGASDTARFTARWTRPALTFPADSPGMVRFGLAAEGGVQLPSGRTLTLDAFVTTTASPEVTRDASGCFARLSLAQADPGVVRLSYAGQSLPADGGGMATDLPTPDEAGDLEAALATALAQAFADLPDLPLSYAFPCQGRERCDAQVIDGRLVLGCDLAEGDRALPAGADGAIALSAADLSAACQIVAARADSLAIGDDTLTAGGIACTDGALLLTLVPANASEGHSVVTLRATLSLAEGRIVPLLEPVDGEDAGDRALADDLVVQTWAGLLIRDIIVAAVAPVLGDVGEALAWSWPVARAAMPLSVTFTPDRAICRSDGLVLAGPLPTEASAADEVSDPPSIELAIVTPPDESQLDRAVVVRAVHARNADPPYDYAWWVTPVTSMRAEHTPGLRVPLPALDEDKTRDPDDTLPRRHAIKKRALDLITVRVALIDSFGRVAREELTLDPTTGAHAIAPPMERRSAPLMSGPYGPTYLGTAYRPVSAQRAEVTRSSVWGMLAGALATFAVLTTVLAVILVRSLGSSANPRTSTTITLPSPTATVVLTPQSTIASTATTAPTAKPKPTSTPVPFGRFSEDTTSLVFTCDGSGNTLPLSLMLSNSGTAALNWEAHAIDMLGGQPWATVSPDSGRLTPGQSVSIAVTPQTPAFCQAPSTAVFRVQFTAPGAVPSTITASHS
jgi:hypothetical protein